MNEQNSLIFVQNPLEFRCIRRNFRPHFHENFSILLMSGKFRSNFAKISNKFRESFERIAKCSNEFRKWTKIFVFVHIFVCWTKFSRNWLKENLETLILFSLECILYFKKYDFDELNILEFIIHWLPTHH